MRLAILGAPGAGKGTQAHFVSLHYNIPHISTGELLRDEMKRETEIGKAIEHLMSCGKLVSDETVVTILKERIKQVDCAKGFLLDGFPRTLTQAKNAEEVVGKFDKVISVHVPDDVIIKRMDGRRICSSCGATFHLVYKPPKKDGICDECSNALVQRADDKAKTVRDRLDIYHKEAEPIKDFYKNKGILLVVTGEGNIEDITKEITSNLDKK